MCAESQEKLFARIPAAREAWGTAQGTEQLASAVGDDVVAFELDIDSGTVAPPCAREGWDGELSPELRALAEGIDGVLLEHLGRRWYVGKGLADPLGTARPLSKPHGWRPWAMVYWDEAYFSVRRDVYIGTEGVCEAREAYCVNPDCPCMDVRLSFLERDAHRATEVGWVVIQPGTRGVLEDTGLPDGRLRLERLWARFRQRHPTHRELFAERYPRMRGFGTRLKEMLAAQRLSMPAPVAPRPGKPGRNDPCSCESGRKFKKCCGRVR